MSSLSVHGKLQEIQRGSLGDGKSGTVLVWDFDGTGVRHGWQQHGQCAGGWDRCVSQEKALDECLEQENLVDLGLLPDTMNKHKKASLQSSKCPLTETRDRTVITSHLLTSNSAHTGLKSNAKTNPIMQKLWAPALSLL